MSIHCKGVQASIPDPSSPVAFENFCIELPHTGQKHLQRIASAAVCL